MEQLTIPKHIGIIMDGNGRWAKKRGLPRSAGHTAGAKLIKSIARRCNELGVKNLTVFAFSTENWARPQEEVSSIINLLRYYLKEIDKYVKENIRIRFIGDWSGFDQDIQDKMAKSEEASKNATGLVFSIALNYGGRAEITHAAKQIAQEVEEGKLAIEEITEQTLSGHMYTAGMPDVDLIIRPSGEYRLSNFLIWQSAYAEYVFMDDILWPDFKVKDLDRAIEEYSRRNRRFGGI
ncbi:isoprenyl transferase [Clostridium facile]|uniref:Isoprenyl transferase n=1 Tax=Clostridium facile TaxID=2763035 RepID=A0ABR7IQA2_9CLOT|nr:isoprenyl transferase [Clostridium facile]MBC5787329.1 isoprenyl transferase [Clostridium facile]